MACSHTCSAKEGGGGEKRKGDPQASSAKLHRLLTKTYFSVSFVLCVAHKVTSHGPLALFSRGEGTVDASQQEQEMHPGMLHTTG